MKKKNITTKAMTMAVAMSMVAGLCPSTVFAAPTQITVFQTFDISSKNRSSRDVPS